MEIYYKNSSGKIIYLDREPYKMLASTNLFDYAWDYSSQGSSSPRITQVQKNMVSKDISVIVTGNTKEDYLKNLEALLEVIDTDVINMKSGRLYVGKCYLQCYFVQSKKSDKYLNVKQSTLSLSLVAEKGFWILESKKTFTKVTSDNFRSDGLDYQYDYPFDYSNDLVNQKIVNDNYAASDFEMTIYGSCENPAVSVGEHTYEVNTSLITGEYIVINSVSKKVYKVKNNGEHVNLFNVRGRDFYIFEKIPIGILNVSWSGGFGFDLNLLSERGEPKWI